MSRYMLKKGVTHTVDSVSVSEMSHKFIVVRFYSSVFVT